MARRKYNSYRASDFGEEEEELLRLFQLQMEDSKNYFVNIIKPRLDRSYKLYIAYNGDRAKEIKKWQSNIFVPYIHSVVETMVPRVLDARPEFSIQGRSEDDQNKAEKQQQFIDYTWEIAKMDSTMEDLARSSFVYGTGFLQVSWKKDVRKHKFLKTKDINSKKYTYKEEERIFYDAPYCEWIDNYQLWYDWHNTDRLSKQYWFKRLVLSKNEINRKYPNADKRRLELAFASGNGDLTDYASVRNEVKTTHSEIVRRNISATSSSGTQNDKYSTSLDGNLDMYEVFEWIRPFEDSFAVMVGASYVPILKGGYMPIPYDFKETPFIEVPYLKLPYEFEGIGIPMILENPQIMLNMIKNQRLDATTLSIHKMWIVNPLANINKQELVTRPFGIIYSVDPNGVREVQFSDIKASAYKEEELLKQDMRYASGVDDFSMGAGSGASSATEVRHLRESTLERVRLFVNHLGNGLSEVMRYWIDMSRQFYTKPMTIRIIGKDGEILFPLIEKDDLMGKYDYKATVLPSIAGQVDIKKKQDMDLFQLLINLPFIDPKKLTKKILQDFGWGLDSVTADDDEMQSGIEPDMNNAQNMMPTEGVEGGVLPTGLESIGQQEMQGIPQAGVTKAIPPEVLRGAMEIINKGAIHSPNPLASSPFAQLKTPVNISNSNPPTVAKVASQGGGGPGKTTNSRGHNRTGKVNTNKGATNDSKNTEESRLLNKVYNIQR